MVRRRSTETDVLRLPKRRRWAAADPGRRFDDLHSFVHDPATLRVAFGGVAGSRGDLTAGIFSATRSALDIDPPVASL